MQKHRRFAATVMTENVNTPKDTPRQKLGLLAPFEGIFVSTLAWKIPVTACPNLEQWGSPTNLHSHGLSNTNTRRADEPIVGVGDRSP
jgi:hypothetical protein